MSKEPHYGNEHKQYQKGKNVKQQEGETETHHKKNKECTDCFAK